MDKPKVQQQGTIVVEKQADGTFLVMFPDGDISDCPDRNAVERRAKAWFKKNNNPAMIGVGVIEQQDDNAPNWPA